MSSDRDLRIKILLDAMDKASGPLKAIRAESRKAGQAITATRGDLVKLEKAQADLHGFRDLKRGLQTTGTQLDEARAKAARLGKEFEQTDKPTKKLIGDFAKAKREAAELGKSFDTQQRALQQTRDRLNAAGISTRNLVGDEKKLAGQIRETNARLVDQQKHFADLQRSTPDRIAHANAGLKVDKDLEDKQEARRAMLLGRGKYMAMAGGMAAVAGAGALAVDSAKQAAQFETVLTSIGQKGNLNRIQATALGDELRRQAVQYGKLPMDMAQGVDRLMAMGMGDQDARATITPIAKTSFAYKADMGDLADATFAGMSNLKIARGEASRILEIMAAGDNRGAFGVSSMAGQLPALTAGYQALGQSGTKALADIVSSLEIVRTVSGSDDAAATNLTNLLNKITSQDTVGNFKKFGVDLPAALKKAYAEGKTPLEAIAALTAKITKGDQNKVSILFNDQQARIAITGLMQKMAEFIKMRDDIQKDKGGIDKAFKERQGDTAAKWNTLQASWSNRMIGFGKFFKPVTDSLIETATDTLNGRGAGGDLLSGGLTRVVMGSPEDWAKHKKSLAAGKGRVDQWKKADAANAKRPAGPVMPPLGKISPSTQRVKQVVTQSLIGRIKAVTPPAKQLVSSSSVPTEKPLQRSNQVKSIVPPARPAAALPPPRPAMPAPNPAVRTAGVADLKANTAMRAAELARQNAVAREQQARALADQQATNARTLAEANRWRAAFRQQMAAPGEYLAIGANMIDGIALGIDSRLPALQAKMLAVSGKLKGTFRQDMKIRSPSRVFAEFGQYLTEGLGQGIDRGGDDAIVPLRRLAARAAAAGRISPSVSMRLGKLPPVPDMPASAEQPLHRLGRGPARSMSLDTPASPRPTSNSGSAPARSAPTATSITFTGPITISVQQQPGQDGQALAGQIQAALLQQARAQAARRDSSYEDQD